MEMFPRLSYLEVDFERYRLLWGKQLVENIEGIVEGLRKNVRAKRVCIRNLNTRKFDGELE